MLLILSLILQCEIKSGGVLHHTRTIKHINIVLMINQVNPLKFTHFQQSIEIGAQNSTFKSITSQNALWFSYSIQFNTVVNTNQLSHELFKLIKTNSINKTCFTLIWFEIFQNEINLTKPQLKTQTWKNWNNIAKSNKIIIKK